MRIRIFVGTGGVGKTSVAVAGALLAALDGDRSLVLTIDPSQRLRTALSLGPDRFQHRVEISEGRELWAAILDVAATLNRAVGLYGEPEQARRVLAHPVYQVLVQSLAGMQELMAIERIDQAIKDGFEDLFIDTAPSRHAFEFLDKPEFFAELVSFPAVQLIGRTYKWWEKTAFSRLGMKSAELYAKVEHVLGATLVRQVLDFYGVFRTIAEGYADRARRTSVLLRDPAVTSFAVVTTPSKALRDAEYFFKELTRRKYPVDCLIVNRVWPRLDVSAPEGAAETVVRALQWYHDVSRAHRAEAARVKMEYASRIPRILELPELSRDVDGMAALRRIAENLGSAMKADQAK